MASTIYSATQEVPVHEGRPLAFLGASGVQKLLILGFDVNIRSNPRRVDRALLKQAEKGRDRSEFGHLQNK